MLGPEISFFVMLGLACGVAGWFAHRHGKDYALGAGMAVSLLAGTWFEITLLETDINVSIATAVILLVVYTLHSWREIFRRLSLLDYLFGSMVCWHVFVDTYYGGNPLAISATAYGQWMLPYAAGRYAFLHPGSLKKLSPLFAFVAVILSMAAIVESLTLCNLWELIFCEVDDKVTRVKTLRYGLLYRAIGPVRNPIFLGIVLLSLLPFAVSLTNEHVVRTSAKRRVVFIGIFVILFGIMATVSRGPILCVPLAIAFSLAWWNRLIRWGLSLAAAIGIFLLVSQFDTVVGYLEADADERTPGRIVIFDGESEPEIYTGTRHRFFVPKVYGPIVLKGGPIGYGTVNSSGFPPKNLPGLPSDPESRERLRNVDNSYINVGLAFGWVGVALFVGLFVTGGIQAFELANVASTYLHPNDWRVGAASASTLFALMFQIFTVFWSFDYAFWLTFQLGTIAGLSSLCARVRNGEA